MTTPLTDGASQEEIPEEIRTVERLRGLRERVTTQMGGPEAVGAIHAAGSRTAREHIAEFVDPGSFGEIGTFATFVDKVTAPDPGPYGGGIIGGHATLDGRPVTVAVGDDSVTAPARRRTPARPPGPGRPAPRAPGRSEPSPRSRTCSSASGPSRWSRWCWAIPPAPCRSPRACVIS